MATSQSTIDYILDQLIDLKNIRIRKMFGDYALYKNDRVVSLICDDIFYIKNTITRN